MSSLNVRHTLIQTVMSKPYLTKKELENMLKPHDIELDDFVKETNDALVPLGLELRMVISDFDDKNYYGICQEFEDSNASECLGLKAEVVQLFYKFIDMIINNEERSVSTIPVGTLIDSVDGMKNSDAQDAIKKLARMGYFELKDDMVRIGPRGILEFRPTFTKMGDSEDGLLQQCRICLDVALAGKKCSKCECYVHRRCASMIGGKCPICQCTDPFVDFGM